MANFVLLYSGGSAGTTDAERGKVMEAWGAWFGKLGDKIVDAGNPFGSHSKNVSNGGAVRRSHRHARHGVFDPQG